MTDYIQMAIDELKEYNMRKMASENIARRLWLLRGQEDKNQNEEYIMLTQRLYRIEQLLSITKSGLDALTPQERVVLEEFYVNRKDGYIADLCRMLCVEKSTVYRIKNAAISKFAKIVFGADGEK